jgi:hypothetical protein
MCFFFFVQNLNEAKGKLLELTSKFGKVADKDQYTKSIVFLHTGNQKI